MGQALGNSHLPNALSSETYSYLDLPSSALDMSQALGNSHLPNALSSETYSYLDRVCAQNLPTSAPASIHAQTLLNTTTAISRRSSFHLRPPQTALGQWTLHKLINLVVSNCQSFKWRKWDSPVLTGCSALLEYLIIHTLRSL